MYRLDAAGNHVTPTARTPVRNLASSGSFTQQSRSRWRLSDLTRRLRAPRGTVSAANLRRRQRPRPSDLRSADATQRLKPAGDAAAGVVVIAVSDVDVQPAVRVEC